MIYKIITKARSLQLIFCQEQILFWQYRSIICQKLEMSLYKTNFKYNFCEKIKKRAIFSTEYLEIKKQTCIFAVPNRKVVYLRKGSLAQLVQSTCLTSRGSLVRTQYLPRIPKVISGFFYLKVLPLIFFGDHARVTNAGSEHPD